LRTFLESDQSSQPAHFHEFNALVVELTGNQTLILLTAMIEHISRLATINYAQRAEPQADQSRMSRRATRGRSKLIDLIAAGDATAAEDHWRAYLTEAGRALVQVTGDSVLGLLS
jgi:DNA-binding FadR family transcriptional regulator